MYLSISLCMFCMIFDKGIVLSAVGHVRIIGMYSVSKVRC